LVPTSRNLSKRTANRTPRCCQNFGAPKNHRPDVRISASSGRDHVGAKIVRGLHRTRLVRLSRAFTQSAPVWFPPILSDIWNRFHRFRKPKIGVEDICSDLHSPRSSKTATTPALWNMIMLHAATRDLLLGAYSAVACIYGGLIRGTSYDAYRLWPSAARQGNHDQAIRQSRHFFPCTIHPSRCKWTLRTILGGGMYL
jgi:hypothetical protein